MIGREDLARGNGLLGASSSAAQLLGSGLGPILLMFVGPRGLITLDAATFVASAAFVLLLRPPASPAAGPEAPGWRTLARGFSAIGRSPVLSWVVALGGLEMAAARPVLVLSLVFVTRVLDLPLQFLGYLVTAQGVGDLVGAALASVLAARVPPERFVAGGLALLTAGSVGFAFSHGAVSGLASYFLVGIGIGVKTTGDETLLQMHSPTEARGRVYAAAAAVYMLTSAAVAPLAGVLGDRLPPRQVLHGSWLMFVLATGLALWRFGRPSPGHPAKGVRA